MDISDVYNIAREALSEDSSLTEEEAFAQIRTIIGSGEKSEPLVFPEKT